MAIDTWWPKLSAATRQWLMDNNGSPVPPTVLGQIEMAGGPDRSDPWWTHGDDSSEVLLPDAVVDWIEETANGESPAPPY
ncbi:MULTISPECIES: hypothetical protein [unclassified Ornithinimicrobium]|uniref:hypothetical protein n=1 Tax=unclassified Ornithinimicrobium TaxID=2615080 RepID=UPI00385383AF